MCVRVHVCVECINMKKHMVFWGYFYLEFESFVSVIRFIYFFFKDETFI